jgi:hypothetical protein
VGRIAEAAKAEDERRGLGAPMPGPACWAERLADTMDDEDRAELVELFRSQATNPQVRQVLQAAGYDPPSKSQIGHHRNHSCRCTWDA